MLINYTPFPGITYDNFDVKRNLKTTTIVRGRFRLHATTTADLWMLRPDPDQDGLEAKDRYVDDDLNQPIQRESDYAPYKPATDIIFNGYAHSPDQKPLSQWHCALQVENDQCILLNKRLNVSGEREWQKNRKGWQLSEAEATTNVHLYPGNAYGGHFAGDGEDEKIFFANPHGKGWPLPDDTADSFPAPQILLTETTLTTPEEEHVPAHFSWVPRTAPDRIRKTGNPDAQWLADEYPFLPKAFDNAYYQGAAEDQQISPHIKGNEIITFDLLLPKIARQRIQLPDYQLFYQYRFDDQDDVLGRMLLDTVFINMEDPNPKAWRIDLTWRSYTPAATGSTATEAMMIVPPEHRADNALQETEQKITPETTKETPKTTPKEASHGR